MVDFFTVPPVFVSVYLNRSWLGKDARIAKTGWLTDRCTVAHSGLVFSSLWCHRVDLLGLAAASECTNLNKSRKLRNGYLVVVYMGSPAILAI